MNPKGDFCELTAYDWGSMDVQGCHSPGHDKAGIGQVTTSRACPHPNETIVSQTLPLASNTSVQKEQGPDLSGAFFIGEELHPPCPTQGMAVIRVPLNVPVSDKIGFPF